MRQRQPPTSRTSCLMISDDLAATLGCYGHPVAKTPNLDALASRGVLFERAYCQFPHCNPSRSSMLSGLRPNTTRVTNNEDNLYENIPGRADAAASVPPARLRHGALRQDLSSRRADGPGEHGRSAGVGFWHAVQGRAAVSRRRGQRGEGGDRQRSRGCAGPKRPAATTTWSMATLRRRPSNGSRSATRAKPFFLAVGFHRPHLPLVAPAKYFDLYPLDAIKLPAEPADDEADIPLPARNGAVPGYAITTTPEQRRAAIRGYLACVSYVDAQAGRVLDALKRLGLADNTIVVFAGDHGWHLGEHGLWHKRSLFEESARVPFIVVRSRRKGRTASGARASSRCSTSIPRCATWPACRAPAVLARQEPAARPRRPEATLHDAAFTQARRGANAEHWGRSVRTARWRCTEWDEGNNGVELYDHETTRANSRTWPTTRGMPAC